MTITRNIQHPSKRWVENHKRKMSEADLKKSNEEVPRSNLIRVHPVWYSFIKYCEEIQNGEIERLKIQNGLPMIAEEVKRKINFVKKEEKESE